MFVESCVRVPLTFAAGRAAFEIALDGGLVAESRCAADDGATFVTRVGPYGSRGLAKQVRVQILDVRRSRRDIKVALRWEPTGVSRRFFPSLDADLTFARDCGEGALAIIACYRPPLAAISAGFDRAVMSRAAQRTLDALLARISTVLITIDQNGAAADTLVEVRSALPRGKAP